MVICVPVSAVLPDAGVSAGKAVVSDGLDAASVMSTDSDLGRIGSSASSGGVGGTIIISTSSFWLDGASASRSDARLLSGDDDLCGRSAAPPMIALCENERTGECPLMSTSFGARDVLRISGLVCSATLSPSSDSLAYAALGELAADEG